MENNIDVIIKTRRSIRKYKPSDIPYEIILEILDCGRWAPSSGNLQNWYFIVVKDPEKRRKLCKAALGQSFIAEAPVTIVVCSDTQKVKYFYGNRGEKLYAIQNVAAAIQNILLSAWSKGLGTCWVGAFDENEVKRILSIPENIEVHALISLGYPAESPKSSRKPLEEIVFFEEWGNREYRPSLYPLQETLERIGKEFEELKEKLRKLKYEQ